jgi:hypothetical protein
VGAFLVHGPAQPYDCHANTRWHAVAATLVSCQLIQGHLPALRLTSNLRRNGALGAGWMPFFQSTKMRKSASTPTFSDSLTLFLSFQDG